MQPTIPQLTFLADLRQGPRRAGAHLDASMVGPLIRANLVQWDDEPGTGLGACLLAEHEARCCQIAFPV
jgi:hypothetical protein